MTHSLHRRGSESSLRQDYVFIARTVSGINREGSGKQLQAIRNILCDADLSNTGRMETGENMALGLTPEQIRADDSESPIIAASVPGREKIRQVLERLVEGDYGISITVSGYIDELVPMAQQLGIQPHTVNLSLGVWGKTELLPEEESLELTTMCGHALAAVNLARKLRQDVAAGRITAEAAARQLAQPCVCGVFNMRRVTEILQAAEK